MMLAISIVVIGIRERGKAMTTYTVALISIGHGGHTAYMVGDNEFHGTEEHPSRLSGYARSIDDALADMASLAQRSGDTYVYNDGCVAVDLTAMSDENIVTFAVSGPMVNPFLPENTVRGLGGTKEWSGGSGELTGNKLAGAIVTEAGITAIMTSNDTVKAMEIVSKNPDGSIFGNAGSMDDVSRDVYVELALAFGAEVRSIDQ